MAASAPNVPGIAASDAEIKGKMQLAPIKHAAPIAKQTTPRPIFSAEPIVILSSRVRMRSPLGRVNGQWVSQFAGAQRLRAEPKRTLLTPSNNLILAITVP